jgi:hypothetical protein
MNKEGRILTKNLSLYNTAHVVYKPEGMTRQELYNGYLKIYKDIYSFKNIIRRCPKAKEIRPAYFLFNFLYRKYGKFTDSLCRMVTYERIGLLAEKLSGVIR